MTSASPPPSFLFPNETPGAQADAHLQPWSYWGGFCDNQGNITVTPAWIDAVTRTYAQAVAGLPLNMTYNHTSKHFSLCYTLNRTLGASAPTVIFAQLARHYHSSPNVTTTANLQATVDVAGNRINVLGVARSSKISGSGVGEVGCVWIRP